MRQIVVVKKEGLEVNGKSIEYRNIWFVDKRFERPEFSTNPVLSGMVGPHPKFMNKAMSALTVHTLEDETIDLAFGSRIQWDLEGVDVPDSPQDQFALIAGTINRNQVVHGSWTNLILIGTMIVAVFAAVLTVTIMLILSKGNLNPGNVIMVLFGIAAAALFTGITWEERSRKKYIRELKKRFMRKKLRVRPKII